MGTVGVLFYINSWSVIGGNSWNVISYGTAGVGLVRTA